MCAGGGGGVEGAGGGGGAHSNDNAVMADGDNACHSLPTET